MVSPYFMLSYLMCYPILGVALSLVLLYLKWSHGVTLVQVLL